MAKDDPKPMLGIRIDPALRKKLKAHSVKTGISMQRLVEEAIKDLLRKK